MNAILLYVYLYCYIQILDINSEDLRYISELWEILNIIDIDAKEHSIMNKETYEKEYHFKK